MRVSPQILLSVALLAAPAYAAQQPPAGAADQRPAPAAEPSARAPRIALVSGNVAVYQLGQADWSRAAADRLLASGDWLATDASGRAEIRLGGDALDVASSTQLNFVDLHQHSLQVAMSHGRVAIRLRQPGQGQNDEIDLPGGAVWLTVAGSYDVTVGTEGKPSRIAVFDGRARFAGGGLDQTIETGNALVLRQGDGAKLTASVERATSDEFVKWSRARESEQPQVASRERENAAGEATGATEPEAAAESRRPVEHHARVEPHRRSVERHRHVVWHRHRRWVRRRYYGYAMSSPAVTPFSLLHSLVPFLP